MSNLELICFVFFLDVIFCDELFKELETESKFKLWESSSLYILFFINNIIFNLCNLSLFSLFGSTDRLLLSLPNDSYK